MKKSIWLILGTIFFISCQEIVDDNFKNQFEKVCDFKTEIISPNGFEVESIGEIEFNGSVKAFQFLDEKTGFAMLSNSVGGYVEVFKTIDGGQSWFDLEIGIDQFPRSMMFKDENIGIISVHDVTGCPPPNCQNKTVILKTENGGLDWGAIEYEELKGILNHPQYDSEGNLYSNLSFGDQSTLMKSKDNGEHWEILFSSADLGFSLLTFSFEIFQDRIFISGKGGKIVVIDTNGQLIKIIELENTSIWDVEIIDENNLIVVLSGKVIKSTNGGNTWDTIYDGSARMIGFESVNNGLMILQKSLCPTDVYQVNDVIASTNSAGISWNEAAETTTNLHANFKNGQRMDNGIWYMIIGNQLISIKEN